LLMQGERPAQQRGHHAARKSDVAAEAEYYVGADAPYMARAFPERIKQVRRQQELLQQPFASRGACADPGRRIAVARHEAFFHAAARAHPHHLPPRRARLVRDREAGEDMPAGAARHDEERPHACSPRASWRFSQSMRSRIAMATKLATRPEPP